MRAKPEGSPQRGLGLGAALAGLTLLRFVVAAIVPLSPDEAYYWVWSRALAPGYLDHPPMVALWIRAGTWLAGDSPLGVRLLGPAAIGLGSLLLADAAERLLPGRGAGWRASALLNATLLLNVGAVTMTPDTPLLFFWTLTVWALARIPAAGGRSCATGGGGWFLAVGAAAGLTLASKYTAAFLGLGILLWLAWAPAMRRWLAHPAPWLGGALALAVFSPVLLWNAAHGWAGFLKQGGRVGDWQPGRAAQFLGELIGGQMGLATPLVFLFCAAGIGLAARLGWRRRDPVWTLLAALTLPPVLLFAQHAVGARVQGNWPAIVYPAAAIAACALEGRFWRRLFPPAVALGLGISALVTLQAAFAPVPLAPKFDPTALQLAGWDGLAGEVAAARVREGADFVASDQYGVAAELARWMPTGVTVLGVEPRWALFALPPARMAGRTGILVRSARNGDDVTGLPWAEITEVGRARRARGGATVEEYRLLRVRGPLGSGPAVVLPRP